MKSGWLLYFSFFCLIPRIDSQSALPSYTFDRVFDSKEFSSAPIRELYEDRDGFLWIGTRSGLYRYDGYTLELYTHDPDDEASISGNHIIEIIEDSTGVLWIGTELNGLNRFDPKAGIFTRYVFDFPSEENTVNIIWGLYADHGLIWAASRDGLLRLDVLNGRTERFLIVEKPTTPDEKRQNMLRQVRPDPQHAHLLWITTLSGLYLFDQSTRTFTAKWCNTQPVLFPLHDESDHQYMYSGFEFVGDQILLASWGGGHFLFAPGTNKWQRFFFQEKDPKLPLSDNVVLQYAQLTDSLYMFCGSTLGLIKPSTGEFQLTWLSAQDSLYRGSQYAETVLADHHGFVWVGSSKGLFRSSVPLKKPDTSRVLKLCFTSVRVNGIAIADSVLHDDHGILLAPHEQSIQLGFSLIRPHATQEIHYVYRLAGQDRNWISSGTNRSIQYQDLPHGSYVFEVRAMDADQNHVLAEAHLKIQARKYFFQRWWFWGMITFFFLLLISYIALTRVRFLKSKYQMEAAYETSLAHSEMAALRSQLNPHFLFNALNSIKHFIISNEPRTATRYLNKFAALMRLALDNSKKSFIPLSAEIEFVTLFLEIEQARLGDKLLFSIDVDPEIDTARVLIPPMIVQPYVENAIWHGIVHKPNAGMIALRFKQDQGMLEIRIEDNGIGREASVALQGKHKTRKSMGMKLIQDRLAILEKLNLGTASIDLIDQYDEAGIASGTHVIIRLPLQEQPYEIQTESHHYR